MSGAGLLAAVAVLLAAAAARELPLDRLATALGRRARVPELLPRKLLGAVLGGAVALLAAPAAPGRTAWLVAVGLPLAGFLAPDVLRERQARRRHRRLVAALPDALDLLVVGAASGRGPAAGTTPSRRGRRARRGRGRGP